MRDQAAAYLEQSKQHPNIGAEPEPEPEPQRTSSNIDFKDLAHALQYEQDEDVVAGKLEDVVNQLRGQPGGEGIDAERLKADLMTDMQNQIEWQNAVARFGEEYDDLLGDDTLAQTAGRRVTELLSQAAWDSQNQGKARPPYWDIFKAAGDATRQWVGGLRGSKEPEPNPEEEDVEVDVDVDERNQRKVRHTATTPRPRARPSTPPAGGDQPADPVQARRSTIEEMQRARGQFLEEPQE